MGSISHNQVTVSICFKITLYVLVFIVSQVDAQNTAQGLNITFIADAITKGADFYNWNMVEIRYCDGASFVADVEAINPCFLPENVVNDIQTPLFLLNSDFDRYQLKSILFSIDLVLLLHNHLHLISDFQTTFLKTLEKLDDNPSRGLFITSCYVHDFFYNPFNWQGIPTLQNKASFMSLFLD
ncbi:hypothetical protein SASPL_136489 [Salvia splendens]|uniref:Pectin acetylesterase n=1 Tax=Salvia splendens TaxID=180675 RepID=A0A8X8X002_SALSN|nr:hypothetical protein SASPL_136489 [Salvia splendens]